MTSGVSQSAEVLLNGSGIDVDQATGQPNFDIGNVEHCANFLAARGYSFRFGSHYDSVSFDKNALLDDLVSASVRPSKANNGKYPQVAIESDYNNGLQMKNSPTDGGKKYQLYGPGNHTMGLGVQLVARIEAIAIPKLKRELLSCVRMSVGDAAAMELLKGSGSMLGIIHLRSELRDKLSIDKLSIVGDVEPSTQEDKVTDDEPEADTILELVEMLATQLKDVLSLKDKKRINSKRDLLRRTFEDDENKEPPVN